MNAEMFTIRFDDDKLKELQRELKNFPNRALKQVMSRSLNRTAAKARTELVRLGSKKLGWKQKYVRPYITIKKATYSNWRSSLRFPIRSIDVIHLKAKELKQGVSYKDPMTGTRKKEPHAFIYEMPTKGWQVWLRSIHFLGYRKYINWRGRKMEALFKMRAPSLYKLLMEHASGQTKQIVEKSRILLQKNIHEQVELILKKKLPR